MSAQIHGSVVGFGDGVDQSSLDAVAATIPSNRYITAIGAPMLIAALPAASAYPGKYAETSDLFGVGGYVVSEGSFWKPVRPLSVATVTNANSDLTFTTLLHAPTQILQGTLSVSRVVTLDTSLAYLGARFRIKREASGVLLNITVKVGAVSLSTMSLASQWTDYEFNGTTWVQTASGGLL